VLSTSCCPRRTTRILQRQQAEIRLYRYTPKSVGAWMNLEKQRRIEERAYALWEAEGQLHGRHEEHWHRAAREIEAEETASPSVKRSPPRAAGRGEFWQPLATTQEKADGRSDGKGFETRQ
jgi:Protein of unknown function (DUF2934)